MERIEKLWEWEEKGHAGMKGPTGMGEGEGEGEGSSCGRS